mmetsp:Transcript_7389/g.21849  ORF Transcript_7389/g.21849 Transcript_7389/m.21849 type:complete len:118 (-) Transcript_7389:23-376(-)
MSWGCKQTASFFHSQLAQLAWAINSVDRKLPKREIENHLLAIVDQLSEINTRKDAELRKKKLALIRKIEGVLRAVDVPSSSSSSSDSDSRSPSPRGRRKRRARGDSLQRPKTEGPAF